MNYGGYRWNIGGYLVSDFLESVTPEWIEEARKRIAREIATTFRTDYAKEVSLNDLLKAETMSLANRKATGQKLLLAP